MKLIIKLLSPFAILVGWVMTFGLALAAIPLFHLKREWGQACHHAFGRWNLAIMGIRVQYVDLENIPKDRGVILAPNHESMFDILVMAAVPKDTAWVSKAELRRIPFVGSAMQAMGCYFVKRNRGQSDARMLKNLQETFNQGISLIIFPEGARTRTGELQALKKGAFVAAREANAAIVPVALTGTRDIAKPGKLPTMFHNVTARFGSPIYVDSNRPLGATVDKYREELIKLLSIDRTVS